MKQTFGDLVKQAQAAGVVRADVNVPELLTVVASFPETYRDAQGSSPFLETVLRGLRTESDRHALVAAPSYSVARSRGPTVA